MNSSEEIRNKFIEQQFALRYDEFTEKKSLKVYIGTWNVNGKKPLQSQLLSHWIDIDNDLLIFGFQEIVDLNAANMVLSHDETHVWELMIETLLHPLKYKKIMAQHMVGISLIIYAKQTLVEHISQIEAQVCGVGLMDFMGVGGNKGAVAASMIIYDTSLCFINTHLAAHKKHVLERNNDYHSICQRLYFEKKDKKIFQHDLIWWFGDLNYRLSEDDSHYVFQTLQSSAYLSLLQYLV